MMPVPMEQIATVVCHHYHLTKEDFFGKPKCKRVARPRQVAMYLMKKMTMRSTVEIGMFLGKRDHTTIMHGIKCVKARLEDPDYKFQLDTDIRAIMCNILTGTTSGNLASSISKPHDFSYKVSPAIVTLNSKIPAYSPPAKLKQRRCLASDCTEVFTPEHRHQFMCKLKVCLNARRNAA